MPSPKGQAQGPHSGSLSEGSLLSPTLGPFVALGLLLPQPAPLRLCCHPAPAHPHSLTPSRAHWLQRPRGVRRGCEWVDVAGAEVSGVCGRVGAGKRSGAQITLAPHERPLANHDVIHGSADPLPVGLQLAQPQPSG